MKARTESSSAVGSVDHVCFAVLSTEEAHDGSSRRIPIDMDDWACARGAAGSRDNQGRLCSMRLDRCSTTARAEVIVRTWDAQGRTRSDTVTTEESSNGVKRATLRLGGTEKLDELERRDTAGQRA